MLNDLDKVNWDKLTSAHGSASAVPTLIRELCSDDSEQRMSAYVELVDQLWHQGCVYEASMYSIPFLVALLESPDVQNKTGIAVLIGEIATGTPPIHAVKDDGVDWTSILSKQGKSLEEELAKEEVFARRIREDVKHALPVLIPYLEDPDPTVRRIIADVLSRFREHKNEHLKLLRNALAKEQDRFAQKEIQGYIDRLS